MKKLYLSIATVILYTYLLGWKAAVLVSLTISWHEYSHILAAKMMKLRTGGFSLIPLVGGLSFVLSPYTTYKQKAIVAVGGPVGGTILAAIVYGLYLATGITYLLPASYFMFFLQLVNLIPATTVVDGGQLLDTITYSLSEKLGVYCALIATAIGVAVLFFFNPIIAVLLLWFGGRQVWNDYKNYKDGIIVSRPKKLTSIQMYTIIMVWCATIFVCSLCMLHIHNQGINLMDAFRR